jgi:hypothetical protein
MFQLYVVAFFNKRFAVSGIHEQNILLQSLFNVDVPNILGASVIANVKDIWLPSLFTSAQKKVNSKIGMKDDHT